MGLPIVGNGESVVLIRRSEAVLIEQMKRFGVRPVDGIAKYLEYIQHQDKVLSIASSASRARIKVGLELSGLSHFFPEENRFSSLEVSVTPGAESKTKPHPAVYISAAETMNIPTRKHCNTILGVAYEDSVIGINAAYAANYETIVGYDPTLDKLTSEERTIRKQVLKDAGAHQVIGHWVELMEEL